MVHQKKKGHQMSKMACELDAEKQLGQNNVLELEHTYLEVSVRVCNEDSL